MLSDWILLAASVVILSYAVCVLVNLSLVCISTNVDQEKM
jgi:hypothetical protein